MSLASGARIGVYEVVRPLGAGGMGEVYLARDTVLNRHVALKVLPEAFVGDGERLARFDREAQLLASLNHANIAHVHGFEGTSGLRALVMELVEGDNLSDRIAQGPIPLADALSIARQIAEALEAAHEQGIVHRDLKPANVKVRPDGTVKVLDFGLAKALSPDALAAADLADSPTFTLRGTELGVILGTAAYMAPEQARGRAVDKRADIWAFGVVLYEMLTGARAFDGQSVPDVLAAVVRHEIDWSLLPPNTPARLRQLLARCLDADVKQRLRDIGEARVAITAIERGQDAAADPGAAAQPQRRRRERLAWSIAALTAVAAATIIVWQQLALSDARSATDSKQVTRLSVLPPPGFLMNPDSTNVAISPNGRMVAFVVGTGVSSENQLWIRALDSSAARRIEAADGVAQPFWSPDSERVGFFAGGKLKIVAAAGGTAEVLCDAPFGRGATWNASNVIVFAPDSTGPLYRVPASGGKATALTALDGARMETGHRFPAFLPDGDHFLFAALPGADGVFQISAASLTNPQARTFIGSMESAPVYAEPGWLLFTRQGVLVAQPFDAKGLRLTGDAASLGDLPDVAPGSAAYDGGRRVSASGGGSLAYFQQSSGNTAAQWMDLTGATTGTVNVPPARYLSVALAPDNGKALLVRSDSATTSSLWLVDLALASAIPLWTGSARNPSPVWSPDSTRIVFASERDGRWGLYEKTVTDASAERQILRVEDSSVLPNDWSKDGIVFNRVEPQTRWNIYRVPASASNAPLPIVRGSAIEVGGWTSPDDQWLAYLSDEAGHLDLYVQSLRDGSHRTQVATGGIQKGWWTPDGRHLLYLKRDQTLWRVGVDLRGIQPRIDAPVRLAAFPSTLVAMDLASDGRRFLALVPEHAGVGAVTVVQSWRASLPGSR
jgi:serine/threonine protein kinase/Tol biopolymer transport system component